MYGCRDHPSIVMLASVYVWAGRGQWNDENNLKRDAW